MNQESDFAFKEKRKWQIALRRYVLQLNKSSSYTPFFGIDVLNFRKWIEIQFDEELSWDNFSTSWQFDHIVPVVFFDLSNEEDLKLCWNFINIGIEKIGTDKTKGMKRDVFASKAYFETLYQQTGLAVCLKMIGFIDNIKLPEITASESKINFLRDQKVFLNDIQTFTSYDFEKLNNGTSAREILQEHDFLKKYE